MIRDKEKSGPCGRSESRFLAEVWQKERSGQERHDHNCGKRGEQAADPTCVKICDGDASLRMCLSQKELRNQEAGNHEKYIYAGEPALGPSEADMIRDDAEYRDSSQAVDVRAVLHLRRADGLL